MVWDSVYACASGRKGVGMRLAMTLLLVLGLALPAAARTGAVNSQPQTALADNRTDQILLKDGTVLTGRIVAEDETSVVIETVSMGRVELAREQIRSIHRAGSAYGVEVDPDRNSILLMPTPATIGKGEVYFRSFELFVLNGGYGITDKLDLSVAGLFPISAEWNFIALGLKYQLVDRETHGFGLALTGSHIIAPDEQRFSTFGGVVGIGSSRRSLNLAIDHGVDEDGDGGERVMVGGDLQLTKRSKVFLEWADSQLVFSGGGDDDFNGFITLGFRLFGESMAFTLGGLRPLIAEDTGSFIALPLIMFSAHW